MLLMLNLIDEEYCFTRESSMRSDIKFFFHLSLYSYIVFSLNQLLILFSGASFTRDLKFKHSNLNLGQ